MWLSAAIVLRSPLASSIGQRHLFVFLLSEKEKYHSSWIEKRALTTTVEGFGVILRSSLSVWLPLCVFIRQDLPHSGEMHFTNPPSSSYGAR